MRWLLYLYTPLSQYKVKLLRRRISLFMRLMTLFILCGQSALMDFSTTTSSQTIPRLFQVQLSLESIIVRSTSCSSALELTASGPVSTAQCFYSSTHMEMMYKCQDELLSSVESPALRMCKCILIRGSLNLVRCNSAVTDMLLHTYTILLATHFSWSI